MAHCRYGDTFDGKTTTLCVRRATYWDAEKGAEDPEKKGICSNFLCDAVPGQEVTMTGELDWRTAGVMTHSHACPTSVAARKGDLPR